MMTRAGWRVNVWRQEAGGFSKAYVYKLIDQNKIESVKVGNTRVILTSPSDFLASHAKRRDQNLDGL